MGSSIGAWIELLRADRTLIVAGEATLALEERWLAVQRGPGPPLLLEYATILAVEWVEGDVELTLDSGHALHLMRLEDAWTVAEAILRCRHHALVAHQRLPGRKRITMVSGVCRWSEAGEQREDQVTVLGEETHLVVYPRHSVPLSLPLCRLAASRLDERVWSLQATARAEGLVLEVPDDWASQLPVLAGHADEWLARGYSSLCGRVGGDTAAALRAASAIGRSVTAAELGETDPGLWERLLGLLVPAGEEGIASLLRLVSTEGGLRLGVAPCAGGDGIGGWLLAPCRTRRTRQPIVLGHVLGLTGSVAGATLCWAIPPPELTQREDGSAELDIALAVDDLCDALDEALLLLDIDPAPLSLRESELGTWETTGSWLGPFHQLEPLREARRLLESTIPEDDVDQWSRDVFARLAR
jgi:hypothetical protein